MRRNQKQNRNRNSQIHLHADHGKAALSILGGK
jgi:hypothetical protein